MEEILKDTEVFELAKTKLMSELQKKYNEIVEEINKREIESEVAYIEYKIGVISEKEYKDIKDCALDWRTVKEQEIKKISKDINKINNMLF